MPASPALPADLLRGRRALEGLAQVELLDDWAWYPAESCWGLRCRLTPDLPLNRWGPASTEWYALAGPGFPWGKIRFLPAKSDSLTRTFPHQSFNGPGDDQAPWRTGEICLDSQVRVLGRFGFDDEPYDVDWRLRWRFERALEWLRAAARGELASVGEPFELPVFPPSPGPRIVFSEDARTFTLWREIDEQAGLVELATRGDSTMGVVELRSLNGRELQSAQWGPGFLGRDSHSYRGIWWRLPRPPVQPPWQAPVTWADLRAACRQQDVDLDLPVLQSVRCIRDGRRHVALVGFPIPARVGEAPSQMHWQALLLPRLASGSQTQKGFRPNEKGRWQLDRRGPLADGAAIEWLRSENWHPSELTTRGRVTETLSGQRVALIGAGSLGALIAELMARAGVHRWVVVDGDLFEAGNLARHNLGLDSVGRAKASEVAKRLSSLSPHVEALPIDRFFPVSESDQVALLQSSDLVLDCTGEDEVLQSMEAFPWGGVKTFYSLSIGFRAERLFCFTASGNHFPHSAFRELIGPWLARERGQFAGQDLPREGTGCWHPVFPARADDISILASAAVKHIERTSRDSMDGPDLTVYRQVYEGGEFAGIGRASIADV